MRDGHRLVMVVGGIDNGRDRTDASRAFIEWGFDAFEREQIFQPGETVGILAVQDGNKAQVAVGAPHGISMQRAPGGPPLRGTLRYSGPLAAPVKAGSVVAHLDVMAEKKVIASIPLCRERRCRASVEYRSYRQRLRRLVLMNSGKFISFEGGEGCGKSTQVGLLSQFLEQRDLRCVVTREPGGTKGAEAIRNLLLEPPDANWTARAEALLFAAARAEHVATVIRPAIERGDWVLCDRFVDSVAPIRAGQVA